MNHRKKALIFGISGQDGTYLADYLVRKDYEVHGTSRDAEITSFDNLIKLRLRDCVRLHSVATTDFRSVLQCIDKVEPDEIYNLSGQSSVGLSFQQPVETLESISIGTLNMLESIRFLDYPVRFYNAGSGEAFGDTGGIAADESTAFRPKSPYAVAKATAFWEVVNYRESYGLFACSGILFNHESPLRPPRFVTRKIIRAATNISRGIKDKLSLGDISITRDWGWAPEYVEAMWLMLQQDNADDFVIATGENHSLSEFIDEAFSYFGLNWRDHTFIDSNLFRPAEIAFSLGNASKAERSLGWKARTKMKGIVSKMIEAELKN